MTDPTEPIPSASGTIAVAGFQPESIVVKALEGAKDALVAYLGRPDVERELAGGIFAFLNQQFPIVMGNPAARGIETFVLNLIASRSAPTP